ncbi:MAG: NUDIX domain-containing protein [Cytophagales bacterium]|nr:NUDIX domain-containing protein [Cytophagales bacterium]
MAIFINDLPLKIKKHKKRFSLKKYDVVYKGEHVRLRPGEAKGHVLFLNVHKNFIDYIVAELRLGGFVGLKSVTLTVQDKAEAKKHLKALFTIVEAAGGLVQNAKGHTLMIYRLNKWDFPKGKLEKGENIPACALREVEEECRIKATLQKKIGKTYHTYSHNGKKILKCTHWFKMECLDDSKMAPQTEEGIEEVAWKKNSSLRKALLKSYPSIQWVHEKAHGMHKAN